MRVGPAGVCSKMGFARVPARQFWPHPMGQVLPPAGVQWWTKQTKSQRAAGGEGHSMDVTSVDKDDRLLLLCSVHAKH